MHGASVFFVLSRACLRAPTDITKFATYSAIYLRWPWLLKRFASDFRLRRGADEIFALLGCYTCIYLSLPKFRDNLSVPSSRSSSPSCWPLKTEPVGCPETSGTNYPSALCNIPGDRRSDCRTVFGCDLILHSQLFSFIPRLNASSLTCVLFLL